MMSLKNGRTERSEIDDYRVLKTKNVLGLMVKEIEISQVCRCLGIKELRKNIVVTE